MAAEAIKPTKKRRVQSKSGGKLPTPSTKVKQIKAMTIAGMTQRAISAQLQIGKTTVQNIIKREFTPEQIASFQKAEASVLAEKRAMILNSIDPDEIKAAPLMVKASSYGIFFDKQQLIEGKATSIVGYDPGNLAGRIAELRALLTDDDVVDI